MILKILRVPGSTYFKLERPFSSPESSSLSDGGNRGQRQVYDTPCPTARSSHHIACAAFNAGASLGLVLLVAS